MKQLANGQRILAIDYGTVRIGIAVSDPLRILAMALRTLPNNHAFTSQIQSLLRDHNIGMVVVGIPLNLKGKEEQKAREVRKFICILEEHLSVPIRTWDERFTSRMAKSALLEIGVKKKKRQEKSRVDQIAAALMLQSFLDARAYENE
jgi:putative Holliday junction resolvase